MSINVRKVVTFVGLTYGLSYLLAALYFMKGGTMKFPGILVIGLVYMVVPMTSAIIVQKLVYKAPLKKPLRITFRLNRWFLMAWALPVVIALATLGVSLLFPGVALSAGKKDLFGNLLLTPGQLGIRSHPFAVGFWLALLQGPLTGITINGLAAFGEELGWRGLLLRELEALGFWRHSAMIGLIWGFWHAPLIARGLNYPQHPLAGVFVLTAMTVLLAPLIGYVTLKAGSVIAASIFHGTFNGAAVLATYGLQGGSDLLIGMSGLAGLVVLLVADIGLAVFDPALRQVTRRAAPPDPAPVVHG